MLTALLTGCATDPSSYSHTVTTSPDVTFTCASGMVNSLGYTVTDATKDSGLIHAERRATGAVTQALFGGVEYDKLTVSIFKDPQSGASVLRIVPEGESEMGGRRSPHFGPSEAAIADAKKIIETCGK